MKTSRAIRIAVVIDDRTARFDRVQRSGLDAGGERAGGIERAQTFDERGAVGGDARGVGGIDDRKATRSASDSLSLRAPSSCAAAIAAGRRQSDSSAMPRRRPAAPTARAPRPAARPPPPARRTSFCATTPASASASRRSRRVRRRLRRERAQRAFDRRRHARRRRPPRRPARRLRRARPRRRAPRARWRRRARRRRRRRRASLRPPRARWGQCAGTSTWRTSERADDEQVLDRPFDRHQVSRPPFGGEADQGGERGAAPGAGRAGEQHEPARRPGEPARERGQLELVGVRRPPGDVADRRADPLQVAQQGDPEAGEVRGSRGRRGRARAPRTRRAPARERARRAAPSGAPRSASRTGRASRARRGGAAAAPARPRGGGPRRRARPSCAAAPRRAAARAGSSRRAPTRARRAGAGDCGEAETVQPTGPARQAKWKSAAPRHGRTRCVPRAARGRHPPERRDLEQQPFDRGAVERRLRDLVLGAVAAEAGQVARLEQHELDLVLERRLEQPVDCGHRRVPQLRTRRIASCAGRGARRRARPGAGSGRSPS